jgi:hypothetical protein
LLQILEDGLFIHRVRSAAFAQEREAIAAEFIPLEATGHSSCFSRPQRGPPEVPIRVANGAGDFLLLILTGLTGLLRAPFAFTASSRILHNRASTVAYFARIHDKGSNVLYAIPEAKPKGRSARQFL